MKLFNKDVEGVIFDLDGSLLDSMEAWHKIDIEFFKKHGMDVPYDYHLAIAHMSLEMVAKYTKEKYGFPESEEEIIAGWMKMASEIYVTDVRLKPGALAFLNYLHLNKVPMGIATANDEEIYMPCLNRLGILHFFKGHINVTMCGVGKDNPKIFNDLANRLKITPAKTIVVEDTLTAIKTAKNASYLVMAVNEDTNNEEAKRMIADWYINDFTEINY